MTCRAIPASFRRRQAQLCSLALLLMLPGWGRVAAQPPDAASVTDIAITDKVHLAGVKRLGVNLGGQNFYDSGQLLRNLAFRNPGFEGETWQSILHCKRVTATSCTDDNQYTVWPSNFLKGGHFRFLSGAAAGLSGSIESSTQGQPADPGGGITFSFAALSRQSSTNDFVLVQWSHAGHAEAGWWGDTMHSGASFATEFRDLSPHTPGKQALRMEAAGPGQSARIHSYFDSSDGRSFVQMKGRYTLAFRAKGAGGNNLLHIGILRADSRREDEILFGDRSLQLTSEWKDYSYDWTAAENGSPVGKVDLSFAVSGADILLDDVSLTAAASVDNPTAFRDEVVRTLRELKPGILRYDDTATDTGSTIDNILAPQFARVRAGYSTQSAEQDQIPLGLHEVLELCKAVGAEPWYSLPAAVTPEEAKNLIEYLAGAPTTPYGAKRAALGQRAAWTTVFPVIHLEFGNELWNAVTFYGATIADAAAYGRRGAEVFAGGRSSPSFMQGKFDLILGSFAVNPWWTGRELANSAHYDSVAVAPYLFYKLADTASREAVFGPMFAEPEMIDTRGYMFEQAQAARSAGHPARLEIYEVNLSTDEGDAPQTEVDAIVPSLGAGLTVAEHMLLMMRDLGITDQAAYSLSGFANKFRNPRDQGEHTPLWGMVVDMGGPSNLRRPSFLAEQLANQAILSTMLETRVTGGNPTWKQGLDKGNGIQLEEAHALQVFAFRDAKRRSLIVFNLDRGKPHSITLSGDAPSGSIRLSQLTSGRITDSNEQKEVVRIVHAALAVSPATTPLALPPFSMTVLEWDSAR